MLNGIIICNFGNHFFLFEFLLYGRFMPIELHIGNLLNKHNNSKTVYTRRKRHFQIGSYYCLVLLLIQICVFEKESTVCAVSIQNLLLIVFGSRIASTSLSVIALTSLKRTRALIDS